MGQSFFRKSRWKFPEYCGGNKSAWRDLSEACKRRDGYQCVLCGAKGKKIGGFVELNAAHIISKSRGGEDNLNNLRTLCLTCHAKDPGHGHLNRGGLF